MHLITTLKIIFNSIFDHSLTYDHQPFFPPSVPTPQPFFPPSVFTPQPFFPVVPVPQSPLLQFLLPSPASPYSKSLLHVHQSLLL